VRVEAGMKGVGLTAEFLQNFYRISTEFLQPGVQRERFRNLVSFLMFGSLSVCKVLFYRPFE